MNYNNVYLVGSGSFLPGPPVANDEIDRFIKPLSTISERLKSRILRENGIKTRHYGIDVEGRTRYSWSQMGAESVKKSLADANISIEEVGLLAAGSCGGDVVMPGFANMLQAELKAPPMETSSHLGICASGVTALRHCADAVELNRYRYAVTTGCEFASRIFKDTRFPKNLDIDFDSHFLRWMLSDGAGSFVLSNQPAPNKLSLKLQHLHIKSFSGDFPLCMHMGTPYDDHNTSYLDYPNLVEAEKAGAFLLRQNIRLIPQLFEVSFHEYAKLIKQGVFKPNEIDHFVCHYSSQKFEPVVRDMMNNINLVIPDERWYSSLTKRGNIGSASIFVMLDDCIKERNMKAGEKVLCFVPESGRFSCGFMLFEVVEPSQNQGSSLKQNTNSSLPLVQPPVLAEEAQNEQFKNLLLELSDVWHDFRSEMWRTPFLSKITKQQLEKSDYLRWMENWIPQVRMGSKWMRTAIANITDSRFFDLKNLIETHAGEEQNDWEILFNDYLSVNGTIQDKEAFALSSAGTDLNEFMFARANSENAVDLLGGIYIIEGTGKRIIPFMLPLVRSQLKLGADSFKFLQYHGANDENHLLRWMVAVQMVLAHDHDGTLAQRMVDTAKKVAKLYTAQMKEV